MMILFQRYKPSSPRLSLLEMTLEKPILHSVLLTSMQNVTDGLYVSTLLDHSCLRLPCASLVREQPSSSQLCRIDPLVDPSAC
jgi:hypothetical protein